MLYRITLAATNDGRATFAVVERHNTTFAYGGKGGLWTGRTETKRYRAYPASVRATAEAERIIRDHAKRNDITEIEIVRA